MRLGVTFIQAELSLPSLPASASGSVLTSEPASSQSDHGPQKRDFPKFSRLGCGEISLLTELFLKTFASGTIIHPHPIARKGHR